MEWLIQAAAARRGDTEAKRELREYLLPFAHGVLLGHLPQTQAAALVNAVLDEAFNQLSVAATDAGVGRLLLGIARHRGTLEAVQPEPGSGKPQVDTARSRLAVLQQLKEPLPEVMAMRLVNGLSGPELASVMQANEADVRRALEHGATELARAALGATVNLAGDAYLWDLSGVPNASVARLETELSLLRFDPDAPLGADPSQVVTPPMSRPVPGVDRTVQDLKPVAAMPSWHRDEPTTSDVSPLLVNPAAQAGASNPFTADPATQHAADLPVAAVAGAVPLPTTDQAPQVARKSGQRPGPGADEVTTSQAPGVARKSGPRPAAPDEPLDLPTRPAVQVAPNGQEQIRTSMTPLFGELDTDATRAQLPPALARSGPQPAPPPDQASVETPLASSSAQYFDRAPIPDLPEWNLRGPVPLVLVGVLVAIAAVSAWYGVSLSERNARGSWVMKEIVVANRDLDTDTPVGWSDIATRYVPAQSVGGSVLAYNSETARLIIDKRLAFPVQAGDPLLLEHFQVHWSSKNLSALLQKRARAVTIATNTVSAVGRHLQPGDLVDVLLAVNKGPAPYTPEEEKRFRAAGLRHPPKKRTSANDWQSRTLMERVQVVATGPISAVTTEKMLGSRAKDWQSVSFVVMPEEAEVLVLAQQVGHIQLALRNQEDPDTAAGNEGNVSITTLLTGERMARVAKKRRETIKIMRNR